MDTFEEEDDIPLTMSRTSYWEAHKPAPATHRPTKSLKQSHVFGCVPKTANELHLEAQAAERARKARRETDDMVVNSGLIHTHPSSSPTTNNFSKPSLRQSHVFGCAPKTEEEIRRHAETTELARKTAEDLETSRQNEAFLNSVWKGHDLGDLDIGAHVTYERLEAVDRAVSRGGLIAGDSPFEHKDELKENGAKWNGELRAWCAPSRDVLLKLYDSKKWAPRLDPPLDEQDVPWFIQQTRRLELRHDSAKCPPHHTVSRSTQASESIEEKLLRERQLIKRNRYELGIPDDQEMHLQKLDALAVPRIASLVADPCTCLGPHAGISNVQRLLRAIHLKIVSADVIAHVATLVADGVLTHDEGRSRIEKHAHQLWKQGPLV